MASQEYRPLVRRHVETVAGGGVRKLIPRRSGGRRVRLARSHDAHSAKPRMVRLWDATIPCGNDKVGAVGIRV